jgi:hypothetical protein
MMADPHDHDDSLVVADGIDDPVSADANPVAVSLSRELLATCRPWTIHQRSDGGDDAPTILYLAHGVDLPGRGRLDEDSIASHGA